MLLSSDEPAAGLSPVLAKLFQSMLESGQTETHAVAACLNGVAQNGEAYATDDSMRASAEELLVAVQRVLQVLPVVATVAVGESPV